MDARTIETKSFARGAFGSYKSDDVDAFMQEVISYVKGLEKEKEGLLHDIKLLADKTEEYRASEEAVREALVKAQKYGNKIINDAETEAEEIKGAAEDKAAQTVESAHQRALDISNEAMEETEKLIRDLKNKALLELNELKKQTAIERKTLEIAKAAASSFKADLFELYRVHLDAINRIPDLSETDYRPEVFPEETTEEDKALEKAVDEVLEEAPDAAFAEEKDVPEQAEEAPAKEEEPKQKEPENQLSFESLDADIPQDKEKAPLSDGDTSVIPVEKIDGDKTPEDVRRTMQDVSHPVRGRKYTDLKFGDK